MCLQCLTKARTIVREVLPGYALKKSTVNHDEWPVGYYGLVRCNDPDYVWEGKPIINPYEELSDKQINILSDSDSKVKKYNAFFKLVEEMEPKFLNSPELGYALYKACKKAGYNEKKHGLRLLCWLVHYMALKMKRKKK